MSTAPAFSPGPWSTRGPLRGKRAEQRLARLVAAVLAPQRADDAELEAIRFAPERFDQVHVLGARERHLRKIRVARHRDLHAGHETAATGIAPLRLTDFATLSNSRIPSDDPSSGFARPLRVRHHPEHVATLIDDTRDVVHRPVRRLRSPPPIRPAAHIETPPAARVPASSSVSSSATYRPSPCDTGICSTSPRAHPAVNAVSTVSTRNHVGRAPKLQRAVARQCPRQQMRLAQNLKPIADAPDKSASTRKLGNGLHQRRKPSDGPRTQVVAIREPTRKNHAISAAQIPILVPEHHRLMPGQLDRVPAIAIRPRPGKHRDPKPHQRTTRPKVGRAWAEAGHLAARATPPGESEGRNGEGVPTPCPPQSTPSPPFTTPAR